MNETTRSNSDQIMIGIAKYDTIQSQIRNYIFGSDNFRKATSEVLHITHVAEADLLLQVENAKADKRRQEAEIKFIKLD